MPFTFFSGPSRRGSSLGFFGIFGRSSDLRALDRALRAADLHPALVPEGVKLATVNRMKDEHGGAFPPDDAYGSVADLLACCVLGEDAFAQAHGETRLAHVTPRIVEAADGTAGLDADLILLLIHARLLHADMAEAYGLEAEVDD